MNDKNAMIFTRLCILFTILCCVGIAKFETSDIGKTLEIERRQCKNVFGKVVESYVSNNGGGLVLAGFGGGHVSSDRNVIIEFENGKRKSFKSLLEVGKTIYIQKCKDKYGEYEYDLPR